MRVLHVTSMLALKTDGGTAERTFQMIRYLAMHDVQKADIIHLMGHWGVMNALVYFADWCVENLKEASFR